MVSCPNSLINAVSSFGAPIVPVEYEWPICAFPNALTFPVFGFVGGTFVEGAVPVKTFGAETVLLFTASICPDRSFTFWFRLSTANPTVLNSVFSPLWYPLPVTPYFLPGLTWQGFLPHL